MGLRYIYIYNIYLICIYKLHIFLVSWNFIFLYNHVTSHVNITFPSWSCYFDRSIWPSHFLMQNLSVTPCHPQSPAYPGVHSAPHSLASPDSLNSSSAGLPPLFLHGFSYNVPYLSCATQPRGTFSGAWLLSSTTFPHLFWVKGPSMGPHSVLGVLEFSHLMTWHWNDVWVQLTC